MSLPKDRWDQVYSFRSASDKERAYRRGFDQGVAALAYLLGITNDDLQASAWKNRVANWRRFDVSGTNNPPEPTQTEIAQLRRYLSND